MLNLNNKAGCLTCIYNLIIVQPDDIEANEYYSCEKYKKVPHEIPANKEGCPFYSNSKSN